MNSLQRVRGAARATGAGGAIQRCPGPNSWQRALSPWVTQRGPETQGLSRGLVTFRRRREAHAQEAGDWHPPSSSPPVSSPGPAGASNTQTAGQKVTKQFQMANATRREQNSTNQRNLSPQRKGTETWREMDIRTWGAVKGKYEATTQEQGSGKAADESSWERTGIKHSVVGS